MSRRTNDPLGWDYPAGAEDDPRAPYNQPLPPDDEKCEDCGLDIEPRNNEESCECEE